MTELLLLTPVSKNHPLDYLHCRNKGPGEINSELETKPNIVTGNMNLTVNLNSSMNLNLVETGKQMVEKDSMVAMETHCVYKPETFPKSKLNINQLTNSSFREGDNLVAGEQDTVGVEGQGQVRDDRAVSSIGSLQRAGVDNFDTSTDVHSAAALLGRKTGSGGQQATEYKIFNC